MRLTVTEKKVVKMLVEHAIDLDKQDRVTYHKGKKREERKELRKLLDSVLRKVTKDIGEEENKNE